MFCKCFFEDFYDVQNPSGQTWYVASFSGTSMLREAQSECVRVIEIASTSVSTNLSMLFFCQNSCYHKSDEEVSRPVSVWFNVLSDYWNTSLSQPSKSFFRTFDKDSYFQSTLVKTSTGHHFWRASRYRTIIFGVFCWFCSYIKCLMLKLNSFRDPNPGVFYVTILS